MNYCMFTGVRLPRPSVKEKKVKIFQGNLDDKALREMPEVEILIVNGDVHLETKYPIILPELVILGNFKAHNLCLWRGLTVTGTCTADYVSCGGDLIVGPGSTIKDYHVPRGKVRIGALY